MFVKWLALVFIILGVPIIGLTVLSLIARPPGDLGPKDGKLTPCPRTPNCVCSQDPEENRKIDPIKFQSSPEEALAAIKKALKEAPRITIVTERPGYLYVESRTPLFRFVDDMEFLVDEKAKVIHVRAAARSGYSDMGSNRRRIDEIRQKVEPPAK
jgi:uncharacterized protein (DUF1499 family)